MSDSIAVLVGAVISAVVAMFVVGQQHRLERKRAEEDRRAERLADFFAATHDLAINLTVLARAPITDKPDVYASMVARVADRLNTRYAQIRLLEPQQVLAVAQGLDDALIRLTRQAWKAEWELDPWRDERKDLEQHVRAYQDVARTELGRPPVVGGSASPRA